MEQNVELSISKLKEQESKDEKTIRKYEKLEEESEDSDDEDKSNVTYDEDEIKEAYDFSWKMKIGMRILLCLKTKSAKNNKR